MPPLHSRQSEADARFIRIAQATGAASTGTLTQSVATRKVPQIGCCDHNNMITD
jgi:hypothetical protein